jgi:hypothetical protein
MERGIVNLTIKYVEQVRSFTLVKAIVDILKKIREAGTSLFVMHHKEYGLAKAVEIVSVAISFGSTCAETWLGDNILSLWLTMHSLNSPYVVVE